MSFEYEIDEERNCLTLVMKGEVSVQEEWEALHRTLGDPLVKPDFRCLLDRREAVSRAEPKDVRNQVEMASRYSGELGRPRIAVVVSKDYDFAVHRVFQMIAEHRMNHDFEVFRDIDEAREWLLGPFGGGPTVKTTI